MKFCPILKQQFDYAFNSIANLDYSRCLGTIRIRDLEKSEIFLHGQDAHDLLDLAYDMSENRFIEETFEDCLILCLYSHVDLLGN